MLALADQSLNGEGKFEDDYSSYSGDSLSKLIAMKRNRPSFFALPPPRVIAFTDPNDLLSYILVPAKDVVKYDVVDVVVSNEKTYLGFLERPDTAHIGYQTNPAVVKLIAIACGTPTSSRLCKLQ